MKRNLIVLAIVVLAASLFLAGCRGESKLTMVGKSKVTSVALPPTANHLIFSPTGTHFVFYQPANLNVATVSDLGGQMTRLPGLGGHGLVAWWDQGANHLAYYTQEDGLEPGAYAIMVYTVEDRASRQLPLTGEEVGSLFDLRPAFASADAVRFITPQGVWEWNIETGQRSQLRTYAFREGVRVAWDARASKLAVAERLSEREQALTAIDPTGAVADQASLVKGYYIDSFALSDDGSKLAAVYQPEWGKYRAVSIDLASGAVTELAASKEPMSAVAWADNQTVSFIMERKTKNETQRLLVLASGGQLRAVEMGGYTQYAWADGKLALVKLGDVVDLFEIK
ncbi:MAG: hypothetical protein AB1331_01130 [Bacillota bacterium]